MKKAKTIKPSKLVLLFCITYMVSYITRTNYGAVISEMGIETGFTKQMLSLALTGSFITYGAGQIIGGFLGDRISPKSIVFTGLAITSLMNLLLPLCPSPLLMTVVWSINGFAQALMWPPIVKMMVALFSDDEYNKGIVKVSLGSSIGTVAVYLLSPLLISFFGWRGGFLFGALCGAIMLIAWNMLCPLVNPKSTAEIKNTESSNIKIFTPAFFVMSIAIIVCGMLRDGVTTWTPSLISESFGFSTASGILSGAVLPILGVICYMSAAYLYSKKFKNPILCAGVIFASGVLSALSLSLVLDASPVLSVISVAFLFGTMQGVNLMLIAILPSFYAKTGKVSAVSGILNSFVYLGSAVSTYGIAVLNELFGWGFTVLVWLALALLGTIICFSVAIPWKNGISKGSK